MKGWLIVNGFLVTDKFKKIYEMLKVACKKNNIDLTLKTNCDILAITGVNTGVNQNNPIVDFVLFWDKDIKLCRFLEQCGYRVFNSSLAIEVCDDKSLTALALNNTDIQMPKTVLSPKTFDNIGYTHYSFLDKVIYEIGFPMVVKECFGSFGNEVHLVKNKTELLKTVKKIGAKPHIFQKLIANSYGRDIRVHTVGDRVVASVLRTAQSGYFVANSTFGGKMSAYKLSEDEEKLAIDVTKALGVDFAGIDILFGEDDTPILCEVNTNAHFKNLYDAIGINVADYIVAHIRRSLWRFG